ncbi:hypothetical protein C0584_02495 [Candidatus Parcubacteria bacterium]|nr:MAG: hypothetical protein C0584_02495 [Candidatus Parcubacteria bacterium]
MCLIANPATSYWQIPLIPEKIKTLAVSIGDLSPQDGDSNRGLSIYDPSNTSSEQELFYSYIFERDDNESKIAEIIVRQLRTMGFEDQKTETCRFIMGLKIPLRRED